MNGSEKTPWVRVTSPHGGGGKGMFFIPEVGEEVIIGFEGDSPTKPYVIGTVYHGKASNSFGNGGNDVKALQTRSGTKMVLNDKDGSVFVEDKDGNSMMMDGAGNINLKSNKTVTIDATNEIKLISKQITIGTVEDTISIDMKSKYFTGNFTEDGDIFGKNSMHLRSDLMAHVGSPEFVFVHSPKKVAVAGDESVSIDSLNGNVTIEGAIACSIDGGQIGLNCK
jgi:uncharacterized protein involved in type VI secretion and phage assembly